MDLEEVNKLVDYYEKRVLTEFDKHFNYLVLEDYYSDSTGDVGRIEDEWFYEEYFSRYEEGIIDLLKTIDFDDEDYYDFQLRLIRLKRIIDTKLSKIVKEENEDEVKEPQVRYGRNSSFIINSKFDKKKFIKILYESLVSFKFISESEEQFNLIFEDNFNPTQKVHWKGTELQITTLISKIIDLEFFDIELNNYKYKLISIYFINKRGRDFRPKQLGSVYNDKKVLLPNDDSILKVIKKVSTHF